MARRGPTASAGDLAAQGERVLSTDEMTGVQALERKHPGLPLAPGKVERREYEYKRHGTQCFIINFDVAAGRLIHNHDVGARFPCDRDEIRFDPKGMEALLQHLARAAACEGHRYALSAQRL